MATATLLENIEVYEAQRDVLETEHLGEWVLFHDRELIGTFSDFQDVAGEAVLRFGKGPYLIRRVGAPPMTLPASVAYRPVYD